MLKLIRRIILAIGLAGLIGMIFRMRSDGEVSSQSGGWREVNDEELT